LTGHGTGHTPWSQGVALGKVQALSALPQITPPERRDLVPRGQELIDRRPTGSAAGPENHDPKS
jgi:hypothetical protein